MGASEHHHVTKMVVPEQLVRAGRAGRGALEELRDEDWSRPGHGLEWTCRETLNHMLDSLFLFVSRVAILADAHTDAARRGDDFGAIEHLVFLVEPAAKSLADVASLMPDGTRAYHPSGMADAEGFLALGILEVLVHTNDITSALGSEFTPDEDLCHSVLARIFPWVPPATKGWQALLWASGRIALGNKARLEPDWWVHAAPLSEWDGTVMTRSEKGVREAGGVRIV